MGKKSHDVIFSWEAGYHKIQSHRIQFIVQSRSYSNYYKEKIFLKGQDQINNKKSNFKMDEW